MSNKGAYNNSAGGFYGLYNKEDTHEFDEGRFVIKGSYYHGHKEQEVSKTPVIILSLTMIFLIILCIYLLL